MSTTKTVALIALVAFLTFGNCLANDFTGDAKTIFGNNAFYKHPQNLKRLFAKDFIMDPANMDVPPSEEISFSGCISYRPVTAVTFFMDYFVWRSNPAGHHLTNLLMHLLAAVLLYFFILSLTQKPSLALMAALLFTAHPIHSETVNSVGYRSDLLLGIFYLCSLLTHTLFVQGGRKPVWLVVSYLAFFLALFAKETALTLPVMLFLLDALCLRGSTMITFLKERFKIYLGYAAIAGLYLYVYFFVMPSAYYPKFLTLGIDRVEHAFIAAKILFGYLSVLVNPLKITILPPLYAPPASSVEVYQVALVILFIFISGRLVFVTAKTNKVLTFFIVWFFITYLPASNLIPLPNPFAFRFMYLPSIAFFVILAVLIEELSAFLSKKRLSVNYGRLLKFALVGLYMTATIPANAFFKSNVVVTREMIRNYPESPRPYWVLGLSYFDRQEYSKAIQYFQQYLTIDPNNPFISDLKRDYLAHHMIGRSYVDDPEKAIAAFETTIRLRPDFIIAYADLAKTYILKGDFAQALLYARQCMAMNEYFVPGYVYAVHSLVELDDIPKARKLLEKAKQLNPNDMNVHYVNVFFNQRVKP